MARITIECSNCTPDREYLIKELATAEVSIEIHFDEIVSIQSRAARRNELVEAIRDKISQFKWLISGSVQVELAWYLHSVERQDTDKVGDIDNITKPILDSLIGPKGLLIDDSQIGSIHTFWMSRNDQISYSVLRLRIQFSNDDCLNKEKLVFIRYWNAMCLAINVDFSSFKSVFGACMVVSARRRHRRAAKSMRVLGAQADQYLIPSSWDFHRTRVNGFPADIIITVPQLLQRAGAVGLARSTAPRLKKRA
ncbi:RusA family crossover junction endodeoxyribonuclease [Acidovorax sp.]|uniref:RusA family crossover junction endodeoxyribonuclease n=1 Tax=Acidovorax sp. TaxID=1872122 RepID=UPI00343DD450